MPRQTVWVGRSPGPLPQRMRRRARIAAAGAGKAMANAHEREDSKSPNGEMSYREIAARLGISRARVMQIERDALKKMRNQARRLGLLK